MFIAFFAVGKLLQRHNTTNNVLEIISEEITGLHFFIIIFNRGVSVSLNFVNNKK